MRSAASICSRTRTISLGQKHVLVVGGALTAEGTDEPVGSL
jgi:hypothetical protein